MRVPKRHNGGTITLCTRPPPPRPLLTVLAVLAGLAASARGDWPHLRGTNYDGVSGETELADSWPATGPPLLWSRDLGQGHSGFVVAEGRAYTQRQTPAGQYLLCLDPDSGATLWETRYDWAWQPRGAYPGPYASPTWFRGKVYYASPTGLVGCRDARTGAALWSVNVRDRFQGRGWDFGCAATPLVEDGRVILPVGGPSAALVALDAADGRTVWAVGSDPASYCPALALTFRGRRYAVGYLENTLVLVETATGKLVCRQRLSSGYDEHAAWPLYREPDLLLTGPFRAPAVCARLQPGPDDTLLCPPRWTSRQLCNDVVSSVLYDEHDYGFDLHQLQASKHRPSGGEFKCLEWATGKVCWATDQVGQASVLAADGKLFLLDDSGSLILARADPTTYHELARTALFEGETCWTPPTLWHGRLFVRSPSRAVCVCVGRTGDLPRVTTATPGHHSGSWRLDTTWLLSREREYPNDAPSWEEMTLWFGSCVVLVFGGAGLGTGLLGLLAPRCCGRRLSGSLTFLGLAFVLGLLGPGALSALADRCLFTWPASLYATFHATLLTCSWAEGCPRKDRSRWQARLAIVGLVLAAYGFFELCRVVGMFIAWTFLFGLPFAFPLTWLAARAEMKGQGAWVVVVWTLLAFTAFFWSCQGLLLWKAAQET